MSRSYRVLALALVGVLVMVGLAQVIGHRDDAAPTDAAGVPVVGETTAAADTTGAAALASGDTQAVTDEADGDVATTSASVPPQTGDCTVTAAMKAGATGAEVSCLQSQLMKAGLLTVASGTFDTATDQAVRAYQTSKALEVDGIAGRQTAQAFIAGDLLW